MNLVILTTDTGTLSVYERFPGLSHAVRRLARVEQRAWPSLSMPERTIDTDALEDMRQHPELYTPEFFADPKPPEAA